MTNGTVKRGQFGFTNSKADLDAVVAWRDAAITDGWSHRPTYESEAEERVCSLEKDGFKAMVLTRCPVSLPSSRHQSKWFAEAEVNVWGSDGLAIKPPDVYDWQFIESAVSTCGYCGAHPVETERVGFAGRCCSKCLPAMRAKIEVPGWCS